MGTKIHPIGEIRGGPPAGPATPGDQAWSALFVAQSALRILMTPSILQLKTCLLAGNELDSVISKYMAVISAPAGGFKELEYYEAFAIAEALKKFEAVLQAELGIADFYVVSKKGAYDTTDLILTGEKAFPSGLIAKVPQCIYDIREATKCIAFELWTAAGFHLHRANETVLGAYWDEVSGGATRPHDRSMGAYLREMERASPKWGSERVRAALRDLKDLHRNPLIHPDQSLESGDEAVGLLGAVNNVISEMLKEIPDPKSTSFNAQIAATSGAIP